MPQTIETEEIQDTLNLIEKKFGKGTIMRGNETPQNVDVIPTGCPSLDAALGIGGFPRGRIIEVYGPESSGKTTLALTVAASAQNLGGRVAYLDLENALDPIYAINIGVDMDNILISQPDCAEDALEIIETLVRSGKVDLIVLDSVAALATKAEIDGEMGDMHVAAVPRLMSRALKKLIHIMTINKCMVIFINQLRANIGAYGNAPTELTPGGKALKFYSSIRLDIRRVGALKVGTGKDEKFIGNQTRVKVAKNKCAPPLKQADFEIIYGEGISKESDLLDIAISKGIIEVKGAWFSYNGANIAQGRDNARKLLKNPTLYDEINDKVKVSLKTTAVAA